MSRRNWILTCVALWAFLVSLPAETLTGRVVGVADGDTLSVLTPEKDQVKVRLEGIDAPEKGQDYGTKARDALAAKVHGKDVRLRVTGKDRYRRTLGVLYLGDEDVNRWLVRHGWAWQFLRYDQSQELAAGQKAAQEERMGLWQGFRPVPPWEFRDLKRAEPGRGADCLLIHAKKRPHWPAA